MVFQFLTWHKKGDNMAQIKITLTKSPIGRIPS
ncbi:MAG: 50S ribosomal protein L30, partial [Streptococcus sp.]